MVSNYAENIIHLIYILYIFWEMTKIDYLNVLFILIMQKKQIAMKVEDLLIKMSLDGLIIS